jgi:prepilin-type N-terminal cleavage/methylation domain-containing protein
MMNKKGFTLIEILIVVAIIAILASIVLVGLGPAQQSGRDARRLADLHGIQNALELYYNKCGFYPGTANCASNVSAGTMAALNAALVGQAAGLGINANLPVDPSAAANGGYFYESFTGGTSYVIGAKLENTANSVFTNYTPPTVGVPQGHQCTAAASEYCATL